MSNRKKETDLTLSKTQRDYAAWSLGEAIQRQTVFIDDGILISEQQEVKVEPSEEIKHNTWCQASLDSAATNIYVFPDGCRTTEYTNTHFEASLIV